MLRLTEKACAPRYVWYSKEMNRRDPVGTCFVADSSFETFEEYSPCRTSNWGYHRQGSCQAGFSAAINSRHVKSHQINRWRLENERKKNAKARGSPNNRALMGRRSQRAVHRPVNQLLTCADKTTIHQNVQLMGSSIYSFYSLGLIGDRLFVGAPGSYYWQGQMYSIDANSRFNYTPGLLGTTYGAKGSVHQQSLETRPAVFQTRESEQLDDDSYLGYSTITGDFLGTGEQGIAVGMPRGAELHGKVLLYTWNLTNYKNISSSQLGSYFGYSLAAGDLDGDGKLDLIIGAPMHTEPNTEDKYDVGRVYVFYQGGGFGSFNKSSFIDGMNSRSRFGHSVAYLGDMNQDGFHDFAVGAPYDGEFNRGAVYIYYGSSKGVLEKFGQVIYAEDLNTRSGIPVNTFGFSVTGGLDMDGNDYPDMAVGAYLSNSAFFFRSRPVVRLEAFVRFRTENKQIDIKNKNCNLPTGERATCTTIDFCIKYGGKGIPQQIQLHVQYILDSKKSNIPRMMFLRRGSHTLNDTITLYKDSQDTCQTEEIYIKNDIRDKLTPLEAEVKYFMIQEEDAFDYRRMRNPQSQLKPVLDLNLPPSRKDSIIIQKNCGHDNICIPNLHINITKNVEKYLLDSKTNLEFDIIVSNLGEDSFETTLELSYPEGVHYKKTEVKDDVLGILCSPGLKRTLTCEIGNPLPARKIASFRMIFVPYHTQGIPPTYEFDVHVNSTNPESNDTLQDNYSRITIDIWVDSALDVSGVSIPQEIYLSNTTQYSSETIERESEIGPQVTHLYTLTNKGPATINEAEMYFLWPWQTLAGDDLLYLLEQPHVPEGVTCDIPAPANYKNYQLDYNPKSVWERLQIDSSSRDMASHYDGVKVETGRNITAVTSVSESTIETSRLNEQIKNSGGDSSKTFEERQNQPNAEEQQGVEIWGQDAGLDSDGTINRAGQTVYRKSEWHTIVVDGKPQTVWTNVTTVKDASGKIIKTFYSTDNSGREDSFGQNRDGSGLKSKHKKPSIVYSSSGAGNSSSGMENLSITAGSVKAEGTQEETVQRKTSSQQSSGGSSGSTNEDRLIEEESYTVGGGAREGGATTPSYIEGHRIRQGAQETASTVSASLDRERANEARLQYEQKRQYAERIRLQEERRRKLEEQQQAGKNVVVSADEEREQYQRRRKQEEEERRRQQEQLERANKAREQEERARQLAYNEQVRRQEAQRMEEERRRQQLEAQRSRQYTPVEQDSRRLQQQREEAWRKEHEERRQQQIRQREEEERRRQQEDQETRRLEAERRRQWQQGSSEGRSQSGYFDERNEQSGAARSGSPPRVLVNHTWTVEGTASLDDIDPAAGGQINFGQNAASGNNFRTQTIDLGMVGRGGAPADASRQNVEWTSSGQRTRGGTFSGSLEGGVSDHNEYESEWERRNWEGAQPRDMDTGMHRGKRQVPDIDPDIDDILRCSATKCFYMRCVVGTLKKDEFISIALRSRLNVRAVRQLSSTQSVKLSSMMVARITKLPYIGKPKEQVLHSHEIFTDIPAGEQELTPKVVPLWIILLSAIAGTLILLLVILLLYKCGFFKRKRPSSAPERQPLRTNGYHPSD
ncbi:hypothetical protein HUJ04_001698 [Dendroctonus ponderosae]|nr:hypothetical protein HUJ04_001698 [Dendroctonus ponderosae]KAH1009330.1 hypothetical protein HUJ04_001698 [Dendroctonus ponderosae]